ncbi:MAG TPA: mechanosensitive ion channel family protein [Sedimentisphaerales bacterium]|nr:mechanosensitive ion channel family protein [Sedimentisphaerales bacterium]HRS09988.1 mechanosensitive ion channel family protein [Sedimentisphaerales bacterium]HRV46694.1 mechanosensitive ion channel family protein [Sedimentisphaerales bacterium]
MPKWLEPPILYYVENITLATAALLVAYLLALPLRRRYLPPEGVESPQRTRWQFVAALASYVAFSVFVLVLSFPLIHWIRHAEIWAPYHQAWMTFWTIHAMVRLVEGLFVELFAQMGRACPLNRLTRGLLRLALMLGVAFLLIRYQLGLKITVLLTSTAIVTGVLGFAMQGVLGNLLAGMSLHASRSMSVGDWIEVDGTIGKVVVVNWRETRLRTTGGHVVVIPNGKLADTTIRNFSSPTPLRRHEVPVAASYGDAPGDVIGALIEAAQSIPTVEKHPAPEAYITGFKDFCIEYVLRFWTKHYEQRTPIEGHVMRMIWYKFQRRGIEIPFPMSGRLLSNFMEAVHAQRFEKPLASEIDRIVDDLVRSDFGRKLMADSEGVCMLSRDELRSVARDVKRTRFTHGETVMRQNDPGESFYVLVQGTVKGSIANSETDRPIEFELHPGALFGEMSLLTGLPRSATMTAVTDCELLEFDRAAFAHLLSLREEIPHVLSDLAAARAAENAQSLEKLRASAVVPPDLARDGIFHRLKRMLGEWRGR